MLQRAPYPLRVKPDDMAEESMIIVFMDATVAPDEARAQIAGPHQGKHQRRKQRNAHRYCEGAKEGSRNSADREQREEYNDGRQRRPDEWNGQFLQRARCCRQRSLPLVAVQDDILDNNDLVVDDQTNSRSKTSQGHEVETLTGELHCDKRDEHRNGHDESRHDRCAPIAQKEPNDQSGEKQSNDNSVAHAGDGFLDDVGLIVERMNLNTGRQAGTYSLHLGVNFIGNLNRVAIRLAADAEQHRGLAVRAYGSVNRSYCRRYRSYIPNPNRYVVDGLDHHAADFFRCMDLRIDEPEE